jgi:protein-tyrosine phosphatase
MTVPAPPLGFRLLYVCVANVCRSVLAERLTRRGVAVRLGDRAESFHIGSAGTEAMPGRDMHPYVHHALQARGADGAGFASRRLTTGLVSGSDLVLTATAAERDRAIELVPAGLRRTFTIREFARLAHHADPPPVHPSPLPDLADDARVAVAAAHGMRGQVPYVDPADEDIPDPEPTRAAFEQCAASLAAWLEPVLAALCRRPA